MYIDLDTEKIKFDFNPFLKLEVFGPERLYYVELREYLKNSTESKFVEGFEISDKEGLPNLFVCLIEFNCDYEISIYKFIEDYGLKRFYTHRYSEYRQNVKFNLHSKDEYECNIWAETIEKYRKIHECNISVNSFFDNINRISDIPSDENVDFYKTYNIGRFPKISTDFRSNDERMEGYVWLGNWKKFWSYQHPRLWRNLSSQQIIDDILGFS